MLDKQFYGNTDIHPFLIENFVSIHADKKDEYGAELFKKFRIGATPTTILFMSDGTEIERVIGYEEPAEKFKSNLEEAINNPDNLLNLKKQYNKNPDDIETALKYADKLFNIRKRKDALPVYRFLKDKFDDPETKEKVYYNLAYCSSRDEAMDIYIEGLEKNIFAKNRDIVLGNVGRRYFEQRDYDKAIDYLSQISDDLSHLEPGQSSYNTKSSLFLIPLAYYKRGDAVKGKQHLDKLNQKLYNSKDYNIMASNGQVCIIHDIGFKDILPWIEKALELSEWKDTYTLSAYSGLLGNLGRYDEAIEVIKKESAGHTEFMADKYPDMLKSYLERNNMSTAFLTILAGREIEGRKMLQELIDKSEDKTKIYFPLAFNSERYGVLSEDGIKWIKAVLDSEEEPNSRHYMIYAGLLFNTGKIEEAVKWAKKAVDDGSYYLYKEKLEKYEAALKKK